MSELTTPQMDELAALLKAQYLATQREVRAEFENTGEQHRIDLLNREPGDSGDESLASALADFNASRFERHIQALTDLEGALQRVKSGKYGTCTDCGNDIGYARLKAYPTAKRCIVCQEKHEREYAQGGRPKL